MYFNVYTIPVYAAAVLMLVLGILIRTQKSAPGGVWFTLLMLFGAIYSIFYALEISSADLSFVRFFYKLEYTGIPFISFSFLMFAFSYTAGRNISLRGTLILLLIIPLSTSFLAFSHGLHDFFITDGHIDDQGLFPAFVFSPGPWYWVHNGYSIILIAYSIFLFGKMWLSVSPAFRRQVGTVLVGSLFPFIIYIIYIFGLFPKGLDPNPFSFAFTGLVIFLGIFRFRLFTLTPLARNMLFENIPDGVMVIDRDFRLVDLNRAASEVFGIDAGTIGRHLGEVLKNWPDVLSFMTERGKGKKFEISRITARQTIFLDCNLIVLSDGPGTGKGRMLVVHNVTGQRVAEIEKDRSEEKFGIIFKNAPLGVMYYDEKGVVELCNESFVRILGSSQEKLIGLEIMKLSDERIVEAVSRTFSGKIAVFEGRYRSETGNKSVFIKAVFKPVMSKNNVFEGGLVLVEDISGRKIAEERIKRTNDELKRLNAEKDRFFSILAHDLRSPFSSFLGYTDILEDNLESMSQDMVHTIVGSMKESANNLYGLLENLLQWSRMQQGSVDFMPEEFIVKDKMLNCIEPLLSFANNKLIDVLYHLPEDLSVFADRKMFETVARNLFTNAVKFTPREGSISISAVSADSNQVEICFRDTGIGMNKMIVDNLFRVDVKTSRTGTNGELSTGLGLILCKEFVEMHGGSISVESREGRGSSFFIRLNKSAPEQNS